MIRTAHLTIGFASLCLACALGAAPAAAQTVDLIVPPHHEQVEEAAADDGIERVPGFEGVERAPRARMMKPGALLLASFDHNADAVISRDEVAAGGAASFASADRNKDGSLGGFEQSDWAATVGAADDVLSNPMLFDANLDREVTEAEFVAGLHRLAATLADPGTGRVTLANLTQPLRPQYEPSDRPPPRDPAGQGPFAPASGFRWN